MRGVTGGRSARQRMHARRAVTDVGGAVARGRHRTDRARCWAGPRLRARPHASGSQIHFIGPHADRLRWVQPSIGLAQNNESPGSRTPWRVLSIPLGSLDVAARTRQRRQHGHRRSALPRPDVKCSAAPRTPVPRSPRRSRFARRGGDPLRLLAAVLENHQRSLPNVPWWRSAPRRPPARKAAARTEPISERCAPSSRSSPPGRPPPRRAQGGWTCA